jgi:peptidoglycan/xylan/chitin deacetylase (PgdA/CDA1 family)
MDFRIDRFATLYLTHPFRRHKAAIPILMYHSIADDTEVGVHPYYRTITTPGRFAEQMAYLHGNGYSAISSVEAARRLKDHNGENLPKCVVITFDDGFVDFYQHAFPVLKRYGLTATMYLPTAYIAGERRKFKDRECMTWGEVRELQELGISFGSHTVNHPQLHSLEAASIEEEVRVSKQVIEQNGGFAVESFAYPYAFPESDFEFKQRLRNVLGEAGYTGGVCTTVGRADAGSDVFFLERLPMNSCDDDRLLAAKLAGSYDWVAKPQYFVKMIKSWAGR